MAGLPTEAEQKLRHRLELAKRKTALQVDTLTRAVTSIDDEVGWARLTELGTSSTVRAQESAVSAVVDSLNQTLNAAGTIGDITDLVGIEPGKLASGKPVRGMFEVTRDVVTHRMQGGATFPEALDASANKLVAFAASEPHRIARDGQLNTGLADERFNRYRRVAVGNTCTFCLMLASRGAVYLTAASAGQGRRYHHMCDCYVEMVVDQDAIARSQALQGDWRNAIRDPQRMREAGALRGMGGMPDEFVRQQATREAAAELAAREAFDAANPTGVTAEAADLLATGGWSPGKWEPFDPTELVGSLPPHLSEAAAAREKLNALLTQGPRSRRKERPVAHAVRNGNKTVISTQKFTAAQLRGLLSDFDEAVAAIPADLRGNAVTLDIPVGDSHWKGRTGGYVLAGSPRIHLKPAIATGVERWDESEFHMPAAAKDRTRRDVIMHEMGHVVDGMRNTTGGLRASAPKYSEDAFWAQMMAQMPVKAYSQKNVHEGFAEMFMQYHIGGPGSHPVADAYAARYRW